MATEKLPSQPMAMGEKPRSITLHILCQSLPPPSRFTLEDVSLSITLAQLKERIAQSFPGYPPASTQKLIYRGKVLNINDAVLSAVVSAVEGDIDSMHLVLPPPEPAEAPPVFKTSHDVPEFSGQNPGSTLFGASNLNSSVTEANASMASNNPTSSDAPTSQPPYIISDQFIHIPSLHSQQSTQRPASPNQTVPHTSETEDREFSQQIHTIRTQIENIERGLDYGISPPVQHVIHLRTQLLEFQDRRHASRLPLTGIAELINRILHVQQRTRIQQNTWQQHLRTSVPAQTLSPWTTNNTVATNTITNNTISVSSNEGDIRFFMLRSPREEVSLIVNQTGSHAHPIQSMFLPNPTPRTRAADAPPPPYPNAGAAQNVFRQARANQQHRGNNIEHAGLARHIRRIWLFARLWCFCYLLSAPGTWRRYIFVGISLLITFLSETNIPQQLLHLVIDPMQRHLEGLAHAGGPADPATQTGAHNVPAGSGFWDLMRRLERSLILLFASLVPGLGERQVQARNAADQAHRIEQERLARARQEEEAQNRQAQEQAQEQGLRQSDPAENGNVGENGQD